MVSRIPVEMTSALHREPRRRARGGLTGKRGEDVLSGVPLFSVLSRRHLRRLADITDEVHFGPDEPVIEEGIAGETFYVILSGEAKVVRRERTINLLYPGDFFGEVSLLDGGPRTASVIATTPLVTARLYRRHFLKLAGGEPEIALKILVELARRIRGQGRSLTS